MIKKLFNLENENNLIILEEIATINNSTKDTIELSGKIIQADKTCPYCKKKNIINNGKFNSKILLSVINNSRVYLNMTKQKYSCKSCGKNFTPKVGFIEGKSKISTLIKNQISIDTCSNISNKQIALKNFVSPNTVGRIQKKNSKTT